jgi:hypothetical protein
METSEAEAKKETRVAQETLLPSRNASPRGSTSPPLKERSVPAGIPAALLSDAGNKLRPRIHGLHPAMGVGADHCIFETSECSAKPLLPFLQKPLHFVLFQCDFDARRKSEIVHGLE